MATAEIVKLDPKEFGIEPKQALELMTNLPTIKQEREALIVRFNEVSKMDIENPETAKLAREVRLAIRDNRTKGIMDWHKKSKEVFLRGGQFVDAIKNQEISINERMESLLSDVEKYADNIEKARIEKLQEERISLISPYIEDTTSLQLASMEEDVFEAYLSTKKKNYEDRIEAEKEAEKQRIEKELAEEKAREEQRLENERLKAEAEKREKEIEAERKKSEQVQKEKDRIVAEENAKIKAQAEKREKEIEDERKKLAEIQAEKDRVLAEENAKREAELEAERKRLKAESDKKEAEQNAKLEAERKANELKLQAEREATAKLQAELKAKQDAEAKLESDRLEKEKQAKLEAENLSKAPIKEQLNLWVDSFSIELPNSELKDNEKAILINDKFSAFKKWAKEQIKEI